MDKESIFELQKIDCNCNDCKNMVRDIERYNESLEEHKKWQLDYHNSSKDGLIRKAKMWKNKSETSKKKDDDLKKSEALLKEAKEMLFQFNKGEVSIHYGRCNRLNKNVSFIPNTCQLETQHCFAHRKESGKK